MKKQNYKKEYPRALYTYFVTYGESGVPSFSKFARSIGVTLSDIERFRSNREFERAYNECSEIRRDYLIDCALTKRFDSSFVKFLLSSEYKMGDEDLSDDKIEVNLKVLEDGETKS